MGFSEQGYDIRTIMEQLCGGDGSDDDGGATTGRRPAKLEWKAWTNDRELVSIAMMVRRGKRLAVYVMIVARLFLMLLRGFFGWFGSVIVIVVGFVIRPCDCMI